MLNHFITDGPNRKVVRVLLIKDQERESKAFSKSIKSKIPGMLFSSVLCSRSYINRKFSPMYLSLINPDWSVWISLGRNDLILFAIHPVPFLYTDPF